MKSAKSSAGFSPRVRWSWFFSAVVMVSFCFSSIGFSTEDLRSELLRLDEKSKVSGDRAPASVSQNVIARKKYPGGADEDDLQVQPQLPIPTRTHDGSLIGAESQAE